MDQRVIYVAKTALDARMLAGVLADAGITAHVSNELLESGRGVDAVGWSTAARVVVTEDDAVEARKIAVDFDRQGAEAAAAFEQLEAAPEAATLEGWPKCPECGEPRSTRCPICHTTGRGFNRVDMGFEWIPGDEEDFAEETSSCSCGSSGCCSSSQKPQATEEQSQEESQDDSEEEPSGEDWSKKMLMCRTCDEPFKPEYPRVCEWCGHEFEEGFEMEMPAEDMDQVDHRALIAVVGLFITAAALAAYFLFVL